MVTASFAKVYCCETAVRWGMENIRSLYAEMWALYRHLESGQPCSSKGEKYNGESQIKLPSLQTFASNPRIFKAIKLMKQ